MNAVSLFDMVLVSKVLGVFCGSSIMICTASQAPLIFWFSTDGVYIVSKK